MRLTEIWRCEKFKPDSTYLYFKELFRNSGWDNVPPVAIFEKDGEYYCVDGCHRLDAAESLGYDSWISHNLVSADWVRNNTSFNPDTIKLERLR